MIWKGAFLFVTALVGAVTAAQQPARDNTTVAAPGTASISGRVFIAGATNQPARRVRVTLTDLARTSPGQTTTTEDNGSFIFRDLPAGRFELQAFKPGYLRASYGASRPERSGTPIALKPGEAVASLTMTMVRGGVITGVVRDIRGGGVPGVSVRVLRLSYNALSGERTLGSPSAGSSATTDDRGEYRAYGLPPGGYLVLVNPPPSGVGSGPGVKDIRPLTTADVQLALQAARGAAPGASAAPLPASLSVSASRVNYAPVFHPGVTDIGVATTVTLALGEERTGIDITIQLVPTAVVSGTISLPSGPLPQSISVALVPAGPQTELLAGAGLRGESTQLRADGTYVFAGVAPGNYTVKAGTALVGGRRTAAALSGPAWWAAADVGVSGHDVQVPLTLQPGVDINGRVVFEGAQPTQAELQSLSFRLMPPASGGMLLTTDGGRVDVDGRFTLKGITPDAYQYVLQWSNAAASSKWTIKSSTSNGRESFESPLRVNPNEPVDWTVTFTDKPASLAGVLQDRGGRPATDYFILVFSSDRAKWTPGSRRVRMTRPATDGAFSANGLPPGEYFLAALTDLESGEWNDPALLDAIVPSSVKVTLRDGVATTQDLRIGGWPSPTLTGHSIR